MNFAVITIKRNVDYVYQSLLSLVTTGGHVGAIHLFVGSDDRSYLGLLEGIRRIIVHPMGEHAWASISQGGLRQKFNYNYWRVLDHFADRGEGLCLCEDDVLYADGFWDRLGRGVGDVEQAHRRYVLSLYDTGNFGADPRLIRGEHYASYPAHQFFGTQGVFYPATVQREIADYVKARGVDHLEENADLLVRDFCVSHQFLFTAKRSLVQHFGHVTTGFEYFHTSPSFVGAEGCAVMEG